jgi:predicted RNA-binding Zn-ribbon protein involved in translation (DUF1610 family)
MAASSNGLGTPVFTRCNTGSIPVAATIFRKAFGMNEETTTPLCTACDTVLVDSNGQIFCPTCDVREYYFHLLRNYGAEEAAKMLPVGSAVVDGRNLLRI